MRLASSFRNFDSIRSDSPLSDNAIMQVAPSIFSEGKHSSRSERYAYIPTSQVLTGLQKEGFQPFMVCQTRVRDESRREYTKHMIRLRHASQITGTEAAEIVLLNSHDGTSSYQMISGMFRFVCANGMVCGDTMSDIRIPHKGNIVGNVIEGAFTVLDNFEAANEQMDGMKALTLNKGEQAAFANAAMTLKYDDPAKPAPITEDDLLQARRFDDRASDLWTTFSRVQENMIKGGLHGRNGNGRSMTTRAVTGIDQSVKLNRALWVLAEEMRKLKA
jgi:hypothetical protein